MTIDYPLDDKKLNFHPLNIFVSFLLVGLSMLFLALTVAYVYSRVQHQIPPIKIPFIFILNTFLLVFCSFLLNQAKKAFEDDNSKSFQVNLLGALFFSNCFLIAQYFGWKQLYAQNITINYSTTASYVFVISILHFAHVIGGIPFLFVFTLKSYTKLKEPISVLIFFSDPYKRLQLKLLMKYWHFLDFLWIYLILFLYINYWLS